MNRFFVLTATGLLFWFLAPKQSNCTGRKFLTEYCVQTI